MTPQDKEHIANVQRLITEMEAAKKDVEQWRSDLGFVARTLVEGQKLESPRLVLTEERLEALERAERKWKELENEYYAAIGMPRPPA